VLEKKFCNNQLKWVREEPFTRVSDLFPLQSLRSIVLSVLDVIDPAAHLANTNWITNLRYSSLKDRAYRQVFFSIKARKSEAELVLWPVSVCLIHFLCHDYPKTAFGPNPHNYVL